MNAERMRVLEMLEHGKITAAEAAELLHALEDQPAERPRGGAGSGPTWGAAQPQGGPGRPRWFRVRVTDTATGRSKANVAIPYGMVDFGLKFAPNRFRLRNRGSHHVDDLLEALKTGRRGTLYDVTDKNESERIEIIVD
jgi:hypothetical protein